MDSLSKKLLYRSKNRGCKETSLILVRYAEKYLAAMSKENLGIFATILEQNDIDLYDWLTNKNLPPIYLNSTIMQNLIREVSQLNR